MNNYYLDLSDQGEWLIKNNEERYVTKASKKEVQKLIQRINEGDINIYAYLTEFLHQEKITLSTFIKMSENLHNSIK